VTQAIAARVNPWLIVVILAALLVLSVVLLVAAQLGLLHTIGAALHGPQQMALVCPGAPLHC
jgi:hypothetical protein